MDCFWVLSLISSSYSSDRILSTILGWANLCQILIKLGCFCWDSLYKWITVTPTNLKISFLLRQSFLTTKTIFKDSFLIMFLIRLPINLTTKIISDNLNLNVYSEQFTKRTEIHQDISQRNKTKEREEIVLHF